MSTSPKHLSLAEVITNIRVNRMVRRLEGNIGKYAGGRCGGGVEPWDFFPWPQGFNLSACNADNLVIRSWPVS
jgi:hypothetical protein